MLMNQKLYQLQFCKGFDQSSSWAFSGFVWILPFSPIFLSCACPSYVLLRGLDHLAGCQACLCISIYLHPGGAWVQRRTGRRCSMATGLSSHRRPYFALAACLPVLLPFPPPRAVGLNTLDRPSSVSPMLLARSLVRLRSPDGHLLLPTPVILGSACHSHYPLLTSSSVQCSVLCPWLPFR